MTTCSDTEWRIRQVVNAIRARRDHCADRHGWCGRCLRSRGVRYPAQRCPAWIGADGVVVSCMTAPLR